MADDLLSLALNLPAPPNSVAILGGDIPEALVLAAGLHPFRLRPDVRAPEVDLPVGLSPRAQALLSQVLDPAAPFQAVVIGHGRAEDAQIFAVLRELYRRDKARARPFAFLDLQGGPGEEVTTYNLARLRQLQGFLEQVSGRTVSDADLSLQIRDVADRKDALARFLQTRRGADMSGSQALDLIAARERRPAEAFGSLLSAGPPSGSPLEGARLFLTGSPHEDSRLYRLIESCDAVIIGEDHDRGEAGLALGPASSDRPPLEALARLAQYGSLLGPTGLSSVRAKALAERISQLKPDAVIHMRVGGDEAAPWDIRASRAALQALETTLHVIEVEAGPDQAGAAMLKARMAQILGRASIQPAAPAPQAASSPGKGPARAEGRRSRKSLACIQDFSEAQRAWFAEAQAQAQDGPFAVVNADAPQEILCAMGVPYVVNQWWASIVAAKQKARDYAGLLRAAGYPDHVEPYSAQGLAAALDPDLAGAPWGGLPRPDILGAVANSDATPKLFEAWAAETGAANFRFARTIECRQDPPVDWWDALPNRWNEALEPERLDLMTAQLESQALELARLTGRTFDRARLVEVMRLVNEQEHYYRKTRDLVAAMRPAPISIVDSMPATMTPQWRRGSSWGRDAARRFYEEVAGRVAAGEAACAGERLRLMWVGRGMWSDMGFYQQWEESHGAVFVWSMYLGLAADGYIREFSGEDDVMRALAARFITMGDELRMPTWAGAWHVKEARLHGVHGAIAIDDADPLVIDALRRAGVPVCEIALNNMQGGGDAVSQAVSAFLGQLSEGRSEGQPHRAL